VPAVETVLELLSAAHHGGRGLALGASVPSVGARGTVGTRGAVLAGQTGVRAARSSEARGQQARLGAPPLLVPFLQVLGGRVLTTRSTSLGEKLVCKQMHFSLVNKYFSNLPVLSLRTIPKTH